MMLVSITQLPYARGLPLPSYATEGAAGLDLCAAVGLNQIIFPGGWEMIPSGISIALPPGYEAQIRPRSGLAVHYGVTVLNAPGTIDSDYRGEIKVALVNHGPNDFVVQRGMRIAQMVIAPIFRISWDEVDALPETARGAGGFGSTGINVGSGGS